MEQIDADKCVERIRNLENEELELRATDDIYIELFALYLCEKKFKEAKNLFQRIPIHSKGDKILLQLELLLNALNTNNTAEFFKNIRYEWPQKINELMFYLTEKTREDVLSLISLAYTSISEQSLIQITQLSRTDLRALCQSLGWSYEKDSYSTIILPNYKKANAVMFENSNKQMFKLTEFVTFLEN